MLSKTTYNKRVVNYDKALLSYLNDDNKRELCFYSEMVHYHICSDKTGVKTKQSELTGIYRK